MKSQRQSKNSGSIRVQTQTFVVLTLSIAEVNCTEEVKWGAHEGKTELANGRKKRAKIFPLVLLIPYFVRLEDVPEW